jgi:N-acetyl-1-D-myo-inositol-2-amino-2-deoxy-alpha-D-glucopyranoside deacetylase
MREGVARDLQTDRVDRGERTGRIVAAVVAVVAGVIVGAAGTLVHRWAAGEVPTGLLAAYAIVVVGAVFARSAADGAGVFLLGLAGVLTTQTMTFVSPNGDVVVTEEPISYAWLLGMPLVTALTMLAPRRWFSDAPAARRARTAR